MKTRFIEIIAVLVFCTSTLAVAQGRQGAMDDETQQACAAILCLASPQRPAECIAPIARYFSITRRKFWETLQARLNFLNLCPVEGASNMDSMKQALVRGAGNCDASGLNISQYVPGAERNDGYVMNDMPAYCSTYFEHPYVRVGAPRYVGTPAQGGYWVAPENYEVALAAYAAASAARDKGREIVRDGW
jgi:hypothetical protein